MRIERFNEIVSEISDEIDFNKNVITAVEEFSSGHAVWNEHVLTQYVKYVKNNETVEVELVIRGSNGYGDWWKPQAKLRIKKGDKEEFYETEAGNEENIATLWAPEPEEFRQEYWVTDTVNYGSYRLVFDPEWHKFIKKLEEICTEEYSVGEGDVEAMIEVDEQNIEEIRKLLKEGEGYYYQLVKCVNNSQSSFS